jgi:hypothetical protein
MTDRARAPNAGLSLPMLRSQHVSLLKGYEDLAPETRAAAAQAVREAAIASGAWIEDPADRDAAQSILDYWTATLGSLPNQAFPTLDRLTPFDPANARIAEESAEACVAAMPESDEPRARDLILRLLDHGPVAAAPIPPAWRGMPETDVVKARLEQAGVICSLPDGGGDVLAHEALLRAHWPRLERWLAERDVQRATLRGLIASAEMWDHERRQSGYLLSGAKLRAAESARGANALLDQYLDASDDAQRLMWRRWVEGGCVLLLLVAGLVAGLEYRNDVQTDAQIAATRNEVAAATRSEVTNEATTEQAQAIQQLDPASITPVVKGQPGGQGYLWIGSTSAPLLAAKAHASQWINPSTVVAGQHYWLRTWIMLRQNYPDANYASGARIGSLAPDTEIVALDTPRVFNRISGAQYWINARQVVRTFVQYSGDKAQADGLLKRLVKAGYAVPPAQLRTDWHDKLEVRYYREADRLLAEQLIRTLYANLAATGRPIQPTCKSFAVLDPKPPPGVLEAWADLNAFALTGSADAAPAALPATPICAPPSPSATRTDAPPTDAATP